MPPRSSSARFALSAAGFIATSTFGWPPGVRMSREAKWIWKAELGTEERTAAGLEPPVHIRSRGDVPVEHERADPAWKQVGVGGAEESAVGGPPVTQSAIAHRLAQEVQVAGGVGGRHVPQEAAVRPLATVAEGPVAVDPFSLLGLADRERRAETHDSVEEALFVL